MGRGSFTSRGSYPTMVRIPPTYPVPTVQPLSDRAIAKERKRWVLWSLGAYPHLPCSRQLWIHVDRDLLFRGITEHPLQSAVIARQAFPPRRSYRLAVDSRRKTVAFEGELVDRPRPIIFNRRGAK